MGDFHRGMRLGGVLSLGSADVAAYTSKISLTDWFQFNLVSLLICSMNLYISNVRLSPWTIFNKFLACTRANKQTGSVN